ncbi:MAG: hypothetical protein ACPLXP_03585 [Microgenomates group bacterium]
MTNDGAIFPWSAEEVEAGGIDKEENLCYYPISLRPAELGKILVPTLDGFFLLCKSTLTIKNFFSPLNGRGKKFIYFS